MPLCAPEAENTSATFASIGGTKKAIKEKMEVAQWIGAVSRKEKGMVEKLRYCKKRNLTAGAWQQKHFWMTLQSMVH